MQQIGQGKRIKKNISTSSVSSVQLIDSSELDGRTWFHMYKIPPIGEGEMPIEEFEGLAYRRAKRNHSHWLYHLKLTVMYFSSCCY